MGIVGIALGTDGGSPTNPSAVGVLPFRAPGSTPTMERSASIRYIISSATAVPILSLLENRKRMPALSFKRFQWSQNELFPIKTSILRRH